MFGAAPQPIIKLIVARVGTSGKYSRRMRAPRIRLSHKFQQRYREAGLKREDNIHVKFQKEEFFLFTLLRREQTILRVTRSILDRQLEYLSLEKNT